MATKGGTGGASGLNTSTGSRGTAPSTNSGGDHGKYVQSAGGNPQSGSEAVSTVEPGIKLDYQNQMNAAKDASQYTANLQQRNQSGSALQNFGFQSQLQSQNLDSANSQFKQNLDFQKQQMYFGGRQSGLEKDFKRESDNRDFRQGLETARRQAGFAEQSQARQNNFTNSQSAADRNLQISLSNLAAGNQAAADMRQRQASDFSSFQDRKLQKELAGNQAQIEMAKLASQERLGALQASTQLQSSMFAALGNSGGGAGLNYRYW